jgi:hypothetical protein
MTPLLMRVLSKKGKKRLTPLMMRYRPIKRLHLKCRSLVGFIMKCILTAMTGVRAEAALGKKPEVDIKGGWKSGAPYVIH